MKKRAIIILLICCLFVGVLLPKRINAEAFGDPLTASMIGAASYSLFADWGILTSFSAGTTSFSQGFIDNAIENYVNSHGGSIAELFGSEALRVSSGKLVVAHELYNGIKNFADWIIDTYNIENVKQILGYDDKISDPVADPSAIGLDYAYGTSGYCTQEEIAEGSVYWIVYLTSIYGTVNRIQGPSASRYNYLRTSIDLYKATQTQWQTYYSFTFQRKESTSKTSTNGYVDCATFSSTTSMELSPDYVQPTVLNPTKEWVGDFGAPADTNLDQLIGQIYQAVGDNNLDVEGEVIDVPIPPPTPAPIDPDLPLSDVPWEGLDNNLQQLYEQGLEEIGTIREAKDAITDAIGEQTGALEDAIADNAGVVSGAIDQAVSDVQTAIGEQTAALDESLSATAEGVETIAEAIEDEEINWRKFDLRGLFPFCIPFDIYNMLNALDASPTAPHVQIPFVIQSIGFSYMLDLDFSAFDPLAAIMRQMELICYGLALAWATSKVIKW